MADESERLRERARRARESGHPDYADHIELDEKAADRIDALTEALREIHRLAPRGAMSAAEANGYLLRVNRIAAVALGGGDDG